ncbi:MAG TPA: amino acid permease [Gemmatimonadales bacterium]|nr:amino acid permease [Gemmatimonadales bacterium]
MNGLQRHLGVRAMAALVVGEVIAIGIFLTPATMARSVGSPLWLLVVWLLMGAMALSGALCYGTLAARFPEAGGGYVYLREAYGPGVAFLYGWKCLLVMDPGITAALAAALAGYVGYALGISGVALKAVAIGSVLILAAVSMLGVRLGARVMQSLMILKLGALALIALLALTLHAGDWAHFVPFVTQRPGSDRLPGALAPAMIGGFFAFGGWWEITKLGGEAKDPARTMPRALAIGVIAVTAIYILTSAVFLYLVPLERVTSGETFAAQAGEALFGPSGGRVFAAIVIVAVLGSLFALLMALPRVYYAMARDGVFFKSVARVHPRFGTPTRAIAVQATLAAFLVVLGTFQQILSYFIFVTVVFLGLTVAGLLTLRRREGAAAYAIPGYPVTPVLFLSLVAVLLVLLAGHDPRQAALGVGIVALGAPVYLLAFRGKLTRTRNSADDLDSHHPAARSGRETALGD